MIIFITGASSGIGADLCKLYSGYGVKIALVGRNKLLLDKVAKKCTQKGAECHVYQGDVREDIQMAEIALDFIEKVGVPDIVIANAGVRFEEGDHFENKHACENNMKTNFFGVVNTFLPFIKFIVKKNKGHLVAISSIGSLRATPNSGAYSASKAAVNLWTEGLRLRLKKHNITVTNICLGFVDTNMTKDLDFWMPGILRSDTAAKKIIKSINKKKRSVIVPFIAKIIWGSFAYLPDVIYDHLILFLRKNIPSRK